MCGPTWSLCLLLWMVEVRVSRTQGQVTAPATLQAEVGRPVLLGCNVTTETGDTVKQVRWLDGHKKLILAYRPTVPVRVSHQAPDVQLTAAHGDASYITIGRVRPDDEGCYRCIFDVYPGGALEGTTCIQVTGRVHMEGNKTAVSGKPASLSCRYNLPQKVIQVLWRKTAEQGDTTTVASFTRGGSQQTEEAYGGRVNLSRTLGDTRLTILKVRTEDEACYTCEFHTYPDGSRTDRACLSVYVLPKPEVSHVTSSPGVGEANCTARSRPAAEIAWDVGGDNRTLGPPVLSAYDQGDGTTVVTSTLLFQPALLADVTVRCVVRHPGLDKPLTVSVHTGMTAATVVVLSVCGVASVLLLCLCVCLCKCFVCTDD
ncbi:uncharacterized protein ACO6RY_00181 [Pungitius sinensis]